MLFTDIRLKTAKLGGYELASEGVRMRPRLRVLYASGDPETDQTRALSVEGAGFVQKPYSQEQLKEAIESLPAAPGRIDEVNTITIKHGKTETENGIEARRANEALDGNHDYRFSSSHY